MNARARQLVLAALRDPASVPRLSPGDLDLMLRLLRRARLIGRLAVRMEALGLLESLPRQAVDQLASAAVAAEARRRVGTWEINRLEWALADAPDIPVVALKGCAYLLAGTPNAQGRMFSDVDLLVPGDSLAVIESRLLRRGWKLKELTPYDDRYYRNWTHELPPMTHGERHVELDLHRAILMPTARLKPASAKLFERSRAVEGSSFRVLAPADMVLHAMTHLFFGSEMDDSLRELVDIDELLRHFGAHEPRFWEEFWARAEELDLARAAHYGLRYACRWLGTPVPATVLSASATGAPAAPVLALLDRLVPYALFPPHPDEPGRAPGIARWLLYVRSHWVKMPPVMLVRHLAYKFYVRTWKRPPPATEAGQA